MTAPAWLTAKPFAHRGLHGEGRPENSLAAIDAALNAGYPVEIDLRLSADGQALVFHDGNLHRMAGRKDAVIDLPAALLRSLPLSGTGEKIPLLADVLDLVRGREGLLLEFKGGAALGRLEAETSRLLRTYRGNFAIQSFNPRSLAWFRKHDPGVVRGQLSTGWRQRDPKTIFLGNYAMNWLSRPHFIGHDCRGLPSAAAAFLRRSGLPVLAWTVRSPEDQTAAMRHADNIIFENFLPQLAV